VGLFWLDDGGPGAAPRSGLAAGTADGEKETPPPERLPRPRSPSDEDAAG